MTGLPPIPAGRFRFTFGDPRFCRWDGRWAVVGPAEALPEYDEARVWSRSTGQWTTVRLGAYIAERTVTHQPGSYLHSVEGKRTRFVVAELAEEKR